MCYLKLFKTIMESCLFETFKWDLKWDVLFETFETFQTYHGGLLIWNFQMRLEMGCAIWNLKLFNPWQELLIWNFQMRLEWDMLFETFWNLKLFNPSQELLIWNFHMRFEMRNAIWNIWNVWNLKLFKHVMEVTYFKLLHETWKKMWNLKLFKSIKGVAYLKLLDET